jgi:hypothetical protein
MALAPRLTLSLILRRKPLTVATKSFDNSLTASIAGLAGKLDESLSLTRPHQQSH